MWTTLLPALVGFLVSAAASLAGSALVGLGIGVVSYTGFSVMMNLVMQGVQQKFAMLPPDMITVMRLLQVDTCISMMVSAGMIKLTLNGLRSGAVKKWVTK